MSKRSVITSIKDAKFLLTAPVFVVDIETDTQEPTDLAYGPMAVNFEKGDLTWPKNTYGKTYVANITDVSFYAPGHDPVVLDLRPAYPEKIVNFIRKVFMRTGYTVIGHNAVFDLRSLGGHFGFTLPPDVQVWDTLVMSSTLMLGEAERHKASGQLSLAFQVNQFGLIRDDDDREFYQFMKAQRAGLSAMEKTLGRLSPDHVVWRYTSSGFPRFADLDLPDATVDEYLKILAGREETELGQFNLADKAREIIGQYVAMDTIYPYELYLIHQDLVRRLPHEKTVVVDTVNPKDPEYRRVIPQWAAITEVVEIEQQISRLSCNQAITGVNLDWMYAKRKREEWWNIYVAEREEALAISDPTDPYEGWRDLTQFFMWFSMVLTSLRGEGQYNDISKWVNFAPYPTPHLREKLRDTLQFTIDVESSEEIERLRDFWTDWLLQIDATTKRAQARKILQNGEPIPRIDLHYWVKSTCFPDVDDNLGAFLAKLKLDWMRHLYTAHAEIDDQEIVNSELWQKYHLFVVCGIQLPTSIEIQEEAALVTNKFRDLLYELEERAKTDATLVVDEQALAIRSSTFSLGKDALEYYLKREEDNQDPLYAHFKAMSQAKGDYDRATELLLHASRDGKIHAIMARAAKTHRYTSQTPNLQNNNMETFRGFFIAPGNDFCLVELDYANAENKMGAAIAGDDAFAMATEGGDFHSAMAAVYWPEQWEKAKAAGDVKKLKELRTNSKPVTFSIPYGAGAGKVMRLIKDSYDRAKAIIDARRSAFPAVERKKREVGDNCTLRWQKGYTPAYVPLWTGNRVIVGQYIDKRTHQPKLSLYRGWNYLQQGGVAEMLARAQVEIDKMLREEGYETYPLFNVHDSLIIAVKISEWPTVVQRIIEIMNHQFPMEKCMMTTPQIHFVTEVGPENAQKWGYRDGWEYPLPLDTFVNQWGEHRLPEDELAKPPEKREAPTWVGPVHEGWTLEAEIEAQKLARAQLFVMNTLGESVTSTIVGDEWYQLGEMLAGLENMAGDIVVLLRDLAGLRKPRSLQYINDKNDVKMVGPLSFPEYMLAVATLLQRGQIPNEYSQIKAPVNNFVNFGEKLIKLGTQLREWKANNGELPEV